MSRTSIFTSAPFFSNASISRRVKLAIGRIHKGDYNIVHKDPAEQEREEQAILAGLNRAYEEDFRFDEDDLSEDDLPEGDEEIVDEESSEETAEEAAEPAFPADL